MNWANRLTLSRLALTVLFVGLLSSSWHYARTAALVIFLIAGLTDFIDGEIARRYGDITNFGKLMDPLVDKIMVAAAFISLVPLKAVPAWAATTIVARDFLITGLRLMASAKGRILPAESGTASCEWDTHLVAAGVERSRSRVDLDYRCPDPLFGAWLCVAKSRVARARSVAAHENHKPAGSSCYERPARCSSSF